MKRSIAWRVAGTAICCLALQRPVAAQDSPPTPTHDAVAALLAEVKDVDKKDLLALAEKRTDQVSGIFTVATRKGGIMAAVEKVVAAHRESAAITDLESLIKSCRLGTTSIDALVCAGAAEALGRFGPAAARALPTVTMLVGHPNWYTSAIAKEAVGLIEPAKPKGDAR